MPEVSKVILDGATIMDVTQDTVNASNTLTGFTGHKNDGASFTGSYTPIGMTITDVVEQDGGTVRTISGTEITGTKQITENGIHDVSSYAFAEVNIASYYSGTYTPVENILKPTIDVGGTFDNFVLYSPTDVTGNGVKAIKGFMVSFEPNSNDGTNNFGLTTNNGGTAYAYFGESSNGGNRIFRRNDTQFVVANNWSSGTGGYFLGGHTYLWYDW